jgi:hypothetical protein
MVWNEIEPKQLFTPFSGAHCLFQIQLGTQNNQFVSGCRSKKHSRGSSLWSDIFAQRLIAAVT